MVARPKKFDWITTAALYHLIDDTHPSSLLDELDNLGISRNRLLAVLDSGYRKDGKGSLMESGRRREFSLFAPLALALPDMFGGLPRALNERCVTINMERHDGRRKLLRFDADRPDPALDAAYRQILLWRREVKLNPDPEMPLRNRVADNWRCLISIADSLGWGEKAREAMMVFAREYRDADVKILLLTDIKKVFDAKVVDRLPTKTLIAALHEMDGAEWCEFRGTRGDQQPHKLKDSELAAMLKDFRIRPRTIRQRDSTAKGYHRPDLVDVWAKYCTEDVTASHTSNVKGLRVVGNGTV
jgi:hypothetical protein